MAAKNFGPVGLIDIGSNSVRFVAYGGRRVISRRYMPGNRQDTKTFGAELLEQLDERGTARGIDRRGIFPCHKIAITQAQQVLRRPFDDEPAALVVLGQHRHAAALEVEGNLIELAPA